MLNRQIPKTAQTLFNLANRWDKENPIMAKLYRNMGMAHVANDARALLVATQKLDDYITKKT